MPLIEVEARDTSLMIRFAAPEQRNPLSLAVLESLDYLLDRVEQDDGVDRLIFTGTGGVFASGANLRELAGMSPEMAPDFARRGQQIMARIDELPKLTIAAVNGFCFGGALDLALACDVRIAAPSATFAHPGAGLGIITGWGGTQRLPRLIGTANALEMFFTASPVGGTRAVEIRLVHSLESEPVAAALSFVPVIE